MTKIICDNCKREFNGTEEQAESLIDVYCPACLYELGLIDDETYEEYLEELKQDEAENARDISNELNNRTSTS